MKFLVILLSLSCMFLDETHAQIAPATDTLSVQTAPKFIKAGKDLYTVTKQAPGIFLITLSAPAVNALIKSLDLSSGSHTDIEELKKILYEQLREQVPKK